MRRVRTDRVGRICTALGITPRTLAKRLFISESLVCRIRQRKRRPGKLLKEMLEELSQASKIGEFEHARCLWFPLPAPTKRDDRRAHLICRDLRTRLRLGKSAFGALFGVSGGYVGTWESREFPVRRLYLSIMLQWLNAIKQTGRVDRTYRVLPREFRRRAEAVIDPAGLIRRVCADEGLNFWQCAGATNIGYTTLHGWIRRLGCPTPRFRVILTNLDERLAAAKRYARLRVMMLNKVPEVPICDIARYRHAQQRKLEDAARDLGITIGEVQESERGTRPLPAVERGILEWRLAHPRCRRQPMLFVYRRTGHRSQYRFTGQFVYPSLVVRHLVAQRGPKIMDEIARITRSPVALVSEWQCGKSNPNLYEVRSIVEALVK